VVTPPGEELFCDRYGRVKVQFHWHREGKKDTGSSCWIRVAQTWAGKGWGAFFWPRAGNEVVVSFEEGDPDQPLVVGSVYNAENLPPFALPLRKTLAGIKSASVRGFVNQHFNGLVFIDEKGKEHLAIHSQRTMTFNSEYDKSFHSGRHKHETVSNFSTGTVGSLPGGGGSGGGDFLPRGGGSGGGDETTDSRLDALEDNASYHPFGTVKPSGIPGLNSVMVYGENLQAVLGVNHQYAVGSNLQMCLNPVALAKAAGLVPPPIFEAMLGASAGGNFQLTLGSNTNFVLGKSFNIFSEPVTDYDMSTHLPTKILCAILGSVTFIFMIVYACEKSDTARAATTVAFEVVLGLLLIAIMLVEEAMKASATTWSTTLKTMFATEFQNASGQFDFKSVAIGAAEVLGVLALAFTPVIAAGAATGSSK
jgi:hypothetical protein